MNLCGLLPDSDLDIAATAEQPLSADKTLELMEESAAVTNREADLIKSEA
jgi:hypothetical protein